MHRHRRPAGDRPPGGWERVVRARCAAPAGAAPLWHTLAWAVFGAGYVGRRRLRRLRARRARRATCCSCWPPAPGCRRTSARRSARSASCAASGWTARGGWPGWRTTPPRSTRTPTCRRPTGSTDGIRFEHVSFAYPGHATGWCSRTSTSTCPPGAVVAVVGENGAGKSTLVKLLCQAVRADRRAGSWSTASPLAGCRPSAWRRPAGRRVPGLLPLRAAPPASPSGSATCRALDDDAAVAHRRRPRRAPRTSSRRLRGGPRHPARADLARRGGGVASGSGRSWRWPAGFMRERAAAAGAGRADRRAGRRDRARAVRAVRRAPRAASRPTAGSRSWSRTGSPPCGWPT